MATLPNVGRTSQLELLLTDASVDHLSAYQPLLERHSRQTFSREPLLHRVSMS